MSCAKLLEKSNLVVDVGSCAGKHRDIKVFVFGPFTGTILVNSIAIVKVSELAPNHLLILRVQAEELGKVGNEDNITMHEENFIFFIRPSGYKGSGSNAVEKIGVGKIFKGFNVEGFAEAGRSDNK